MPLPRFWKLLRDSRYQLNEHRLTTVRLRCALRQYPVTGQGCLLREGGALRPNQVETGTGLPAPWANSLDQSLGNGKSADVLPPQHDALASHRRLKNKSIVVEAQALVTVMESDSKMSEEIGPGGRYR